MTKDDNVKVVVRCRPLSEKEQKDGHNVIAKVIESEGTVTIRNPEAPSGEPPKTYTFDNVFDSNSTQLSVYNIAARPIVENVLEGYNGTIFAYGQTGTGKTFTMEGNRSCSELKGIIPNSFAHVFGSIARDAEEKRFLVRVSYLEIYNEEIRDLLAKDQHQRLEIKERPDVGVYVKDLSSVTVSSADEMDKIMTIGNKNRSTGETLMNICSSRSHAIFTVTVECSEIGIDKQRHFRVGKLHLVDLAGSERQSKSGATGIRLKEASKINLSLSTLGNVISALVDSKSTHIPYRNSKLTRLLQDSLGGNSKTVMCANIGPASYNYDETISTLRYANRAKNIKNAAHINEDPKDALLRKYQQEIEELRKQIEDGDYEEGGSGTESEGEHSGEEGAVGEDGKPMHKKRRKRLNSEQMRQIEEAIAADRQKLLTEKNMEEQARKQLEEQLLERETDLNLAKDEHEALQKKLAQIERRVIVGGVNLLEKAEEQAKLLEESNKELEDRRRKEAELRRALEQKQAERLDIEEKYSSLQEEAAGKSKKLKKVWTMLLSAKSEMQDVQAEYQREIEGLLDSVREVSKELRLQMLVIDSFVPQQYQEMIERYVHWNEDIGDWELRCIAYTGNNMRKHDNNNDEANNEHAQYRSPDLSSVYLSYGADTNTKRLQDMEAKTKARKNAKEKDRKEARLRTLLQ